MLQQPTPGLIVRYVDEGLDEYKSPVFKPALIQDVYVQRAEQGFVHLHVFEAFPQDNRAVDACYSEQDEPGTWRYLPSVEAGYA